MIFVSLETSSEFGFGKTYSYDLWFWLTPADVIRTVKHRLRSTSRNFISLSSCSGQHQRMHTVK
jgi:hypothetical protein